MKTTKLFLDFEFTGLHQQTTPISLGIVSDCGKSFYAEFTDYDRSQIDDWITDNVLSKLIFTRPEDQFWTNRKYSYDLFCCGDNDFIKTELILFLTQFDQIEIWADYIAYDWVLFNQIFGHSFLRPKNVHYIPFDICTFMKICNVDPDVNREEFAESKIAAFTFKQFGENPKHNSLWDAYRIRDCYEKLMRMSPKTLDYYSELFPTDEVILEEAEVRYPVKRHMTPENSPYVGTQKTFYHGVRYGLKYVEEKLVELLKKSSASSENLDWIRIQSANDLPVEDSRYWIANENGVFSFFATKEGVANKFQNGTVTHYKKLVEPKSPNA